MACLHPASWQGGRLPISGMLPCAPLLAFPCGVLRPKAVTWHMGDRFEPKNGKASRSSIPPRLPLLTTPNPPPPPTPAAPAVLDGQHGSPQRHPPFLPSARWSSRMGFRPSPVEVGPRPRPYLRPRGLAGHNRLHPPPPQPASARHACPVQSPVPAAG